VDDRLGPVRDELANAERLSQLEQRMDRTQCDLARARSEVVQVGELVEEVADKEAERIRELNLLARFVEDMGGSGELIDEFQRLREAIGDV